MKKDMFERLAEKAMEAGATTEKEVYKDYYFQSGFTAPALIVRFDFTEGNKKPFETFLKSVNRSKSFGITFQNHSYYGGILEIMEAGSAETVKELEAAKIEMSEEYWRRDHDLRESGFNHDEINRTLDTWFKSQVKAFLKTFRASAA